MSAIRSCPGCGNPLPPDAPAGLCPVCLLKTEPATETARPGDTFSVKPGTEAGPGTRVAPDPSQLAAQFPQLEIIELLGMGGMGMVYKARQTRLDRFVALKILPVDSATHPSFAERFGREAKALAKLNHPGIVTVYDFGQTGQYYYFVMEYVDGMNLRRLLRTQSVTPRQALELVVQICTALQYAHDEGVVHRDIKPENILLNKKGQVKIADFGLAKLLGTAPDTALTMSQAAMGTLNYMAPEQRENAQKVDHRADIYSLGVVFYEMLTGEVPMGRFDAPSKKVQVDVRLDEVVLKALEREPERRYQRVSDVKTGVETITSAVPREESPAAATEAFKAQPPPGFAAYVPRRFALFVLIWLGVALCLRWLLPDAITVEPQDSTTIKAVFALLLCPLGLFYLGWAKFVLPAGFVLVVYSWLEARERRGLPVRKLPPQIKRRYGLWSAVTSAAILAVVLATCWWWSVVGGPAGNSFDRSFLEMEQEHSEWWFVPNSGAYERIGLQVSISDEQPDKTGSLPGCTVWLIAYPKGETNLVLMTTTNKNPAVMKVTLPGLRAEYEYRMQNQKFMTSTTILDKDILIGWLQTDAGFDSVTPTLRKEAGELYGLLKAYETVPPQTVMEFVNLAKAELRDFWFGGIQGGSFSFGGGSGRRVATLLALIAAETLLYMTGYLWFVKRSYRGAWAEIEAGRWNPGPGPQPRVGLRPFLVKAGATTMVLLVFLSLGVVVCVREDSLVSAAVVVMVSLFVVLSFLQQLHSRAKVQSARERGLWPKLGEIPTIEHVRRLSQAGEKVLAIKLYRQICHVSLKDAKEIVEGLGG